MATEKIIVELDARVKGFNSKINGVEKRVDRSTKKMARGFSLVEKSQESAIVSTNKFRLSTVASAVGVALVTSKLISYADSATLIDNKLKLATASTEDLAIVTQSLFEISNQTGTSINATVDLYAKLERSTRNTNISQDRLLKITESINKSFAISGATTQEAAGSIRQLGQALASGVLRGDEFNSIAEQAPIIMEAVKEATGRTTGELRELAATGALTSEILIESLERYEDKINKEFSESMRTFGQKLEIAENNAIQFISTNDEFTESVSIAGDTIVALSKNLELLIDIGKIAAGVYGSLLVGSLVKATAAQVANMRATAAAATTTDIYTGAVTRTSIASVAASRAVGTLRLALAALGGPVGILVTAAASLAFFVDWQSDTEKQTQETTEKIDDQIRALRGLNKTQLELEGQEFIRQQIEIGSKIFDQQEKIKSLTEQQIEATKSTKEMGSGFFALGGQIETAKEELEELLKQQDKITEFGQAISEGLSDLADPEKQEDLIDIEPPEKEKKDKSEQELQAIIDRLKTEEERLFEKFLFEQELLDLEIENKEQRDALKLALEQEFQDNLLAIKEKGQKDDDKLLKLKAKKEAEIETKKAQFLNRTAQTLLSTTMSTQEKLFSVVKDAAAGQIEAYGLTAGAKALAELGPIAGPPVSAQYIGWSQVAAGIVRSLPLGGGGSSGAGTPSGGGGGGDQFQAQQPQIEQEDRPSLEVTESGTQGTRTFQLVLQDGRQLGDVIMEEFEESERQGRR